MCTMCAVVEANPEDCRLDGQPDYAAIYESGDAAANRFTTARMGVGDTFYGTIASTFDEDWIAIDLTAGQAVSIAMNGSSLSDPYLRLYDSNGTFITGNDDSGGTLNSFISYTASTSGTYYIEADAYSTRTGAYAVSVSAGGGGGGGGGSVGTLDDLADYLTEGYWQESGRGRRAFSDGDISVNISALTYSGQQMARWAFEAWERVADVTFTETYGSADISFDDTDSGALNRAWFAGGSNS